MQLPTVNPAKSLQIHGLQAYKEAVATG